MQIEVRRVAKKDTYTIGRLSVDGKYFCDTLEDADRGLTQGMSTLEISKRKVYGKTAIPTGTYKVTLDVVSPKFRSRPWAKFCGGKIPRLLNVPGFDGVLIHVGNSDSDTLGCILVGFNKLVGKLTNSTETFRKLYGMLETDRNNLRITVR